MKPRIISSLALGALLFVFSPSQAEPLGLETRSTPTATEISQRAEELFEQAFQAKLDRSPVELTTLGSRKFYDRWDELGPEERQARLAISQEWAEKLKQELQGKTLDAQTQLSLRLFLYNVERSREASRFGDYDYPVNQMYGLQAEVPAFLINNHQVDDVSDAQAYISRLERLPDLFQQLVDDLRRREKLGIVPPKFVFSYVLSDISNLLQGFPLSESRDRMHPVYEDLETKIKALKLSPEQEGELLARGQEVIKENFAAAYRSLQTFLEAQEQRATTDDGVWKFPQGGEYYAQALRQTTTTDLTADEIHDLGLYEVARIHSEMQSIMDKVGFEGTLQEFFEFMRSDPQFYYENTPQGKQAYLERAVAVVDEMRLKLDDLFLTQPKAELVVKAVEPFREQSAGKAFYQSPALDGSRPGYYYANLYDMSSMPKYQLEALAYHEAIPGHHMQLSLAQELESLPRFRRLGNYTAYIEGWGLYCELLPKEYGFYADPYSDFGRLSMELFRACRLVVDTGIHQKRWTREEALQYYLKNTPNSQEDCQKMVDRHIVMPGQATAYKVGMNEILRLRESAKTRLGAQFDIREFHQVMLTNGALPLAILEQLVDEWVSQSLAIK